MGNKRKTRKEQYKIEDFSTVHVVKQDRIVNSRQVDKDRTFYFYNNGLVAPVVDKRVLAEAPLKSWTHARCLEMIATFVCGRGFFFEDEENAKESGVYDFINKKLYDKFGNHTTFTTLNLELVKSKEMYDSQMLEIRRVAGNPLSEKGMIFYADPQNYYVKPQRSDRAYYEVVDNVYGSNPNRFPMYGTTSNNPSASIYSQNIMSSTDPFYPAPAYYHVLEKITLNNLYDKFNLEYTSNALSLDLVVVIKKGTLDKDSFAEFKRQLQSKSGSIYAGKTMLLQAGGINGELEVEFKPITRQKDREGGYLDDIEKNDLSVVVAHGIQPLLFGSFQKNGISSGLESLSAIQVFEESKTKPLRSQQEDYWNHLFENEFEGYNTKLRFNAPRITDAKTDAEVEKTKSETYVNYKNMGASLNMINEFRNAMGLTKLSEEEYNEFMASKEEPNDVVEIEENNNLDNEDNL